MITDSFNAWKLSDGWKSNHCDIEWAEMIAIELLIYHVEHMGSKDCNILIRSDNMGVVGAFTRGRSRNFQVNDSIRRSEVISMALNIRFVLEYVNTKDNVADPVSRGIPVPHLSRLAPIQLPDELTQFLGYI